MSDGTPLPNRAAETPISGRDYPEDDPQGRRWSEIWRAVAEEVNANALVSDVGANRLDYSPEDGTLFVPTDGGDWYLGNGAGWENLGPIGDIGDHVADTTNPHGVTAAQADALATTGGTVTGDVTFGEAAVETISGTGATLSFTGTDTRDIHDVTDVTLSNGTAGSVTEDVTLNYYQGIDNTGSLVASGTQSVTLAAGASTTVQFLTADFSLDNVDYFLEVTTTSLTTDSIDEITMGASYITEQTSTGDLVTTDQNGRERVRYDATSETVSYPSFEADVLNGVVAVTPDMSSSGINAAIANDLPAEGGMVVFRPGTYTVDTEPIDQSKPYLFFRGAGDVTITIAPTFQDNVIANVDRTNREFFAMENIEIVGNRTSDGTNEDTTTNQAAVRAQFTKAVSVEDVRIRETVDSSLNVGGAYTDFLFVRNSRFEYAGHLAHTTTDAHIVAAGGTDIYTTNCYFDYATDNAIYLNNCTSAHIAGCRFNDVFVNAFDANMNNVKYVGCDLTGSPPRGNSHFYFPVGGSHSVTIRDCDWHDLTAMPAGFGNAIRAVSGATTPIEDVTIEGCTFELGNHISAFRWGDRGTGIRFLNNYIIDPSAGASRCDDSVNLEMRGNTVRYTADATSTSGNALMLVNVADSTLANNHVIDDRASTSSITNAYRVANTGNGNADGVIVKNNTAEGTSGASHNVDLDYPYLRYNGLAYNAGDPGAGGQWNGNGIEGLKVRDTTGGVTWLYNNGKWSQIAGT